MPRALNTGADVTAFATALKRGGYATDPDYVQKLVATAAAVRRAACAGRAQVRARPADNQRRGFGVMTASGRALRGSYHG